MTVVRLVCGRFALRIIWSAFELGHCMAWRWLSSVAVSLGCVQAGLRSGRSAVRLGCGEASLRIDWVAVRLGCG